MRLPSRWCPALLFPVLVFLAGARLAAQQAFVAEYKDQMLPVVRMRDAIPFMSVGGALVAPTGDKLSLAPVEEFQPVMVQIEDSQIKTRVRGLGGHKSNIELRFYAKFTAPVRLENVFFVIELNTPQAGKLLFAYEVGTLEARETKSMKLRVPLNTVIGGGRQRIHVFASGAEVLNSLMPPGRLEAAVDRITAKRIAGISDAEAAPFVGPAPAYPEKLLQSKVTGRAIVTLRISKKGRVLDPVVKEATDPAFGEAALAAARAWRFLPRIKAGHPVECEINLPFDFAPPAADTPDTKE